MSEIHTGGCACGAAFFTASREAIFSRNRAGLSEFLFSFRPRDEHTRREAMDPHTQALLVVAAFGAASALVLVGVVTLRLRANGASFRARSQRS